MDSFSIQSGSQPSGQLDWAGLMIFLYLAVGCTCVWLLILPSQLLLLQKKHQIRVRSNVQVKHLVAAARAPILVDAQECVNTDYGRYTHLWGNRYPPSDDFGGTEEQINADLNLVQVSIALVCWRCCHLGTCCLACLGGRSYTFGRCSDWMLQGTRSYMSTYFAFHYHSMTRQLGTRALRSGVCSGDK